MGQTISNSCPVLGQGQSSTYLVLTSSLHLLIIHDNSKRTGNQPLTQTLSASGTPPSSLLCSLNICNQSTDVLPHLSVNNPSSRGCILLGLKMIFSQNCAVSAPQCLWAALHWMWVNVLWHILENAQYGLEIIFTWVFSTSASRQTEKNFLFLWNFVVLASFKSCLNGARDWNELSRWRATSVTSVLSCHNNLVDVCGSRNFENHARWWGFLPQGSRRHV